MPFGITLFADFYCRIVIAAGNTGLSGKGAVIAAPQYHKKERSSDDWRGSRPKFRNRAGCSLLVTQFIYTLFYFFDFLF